MASRFEPLARPAAPRRTATDLAVEAYGNILDDRDAQAARRARVLGREVGLPGNTVEADLPGFEAEKSNTEAYGLLSTDLMLARFAADPHNAAAIKDDLPPIAEMSAIFQLADDRGDPMGRDFINYMKRQRQQRRGLLSAFDVLPSPHRYTFANARMPDFRNAPDIQTGRVTPGQVVEGLGATAQSAIAGSGRGVEQFLADAVGLGDAYRNTDYYKKISGNIDQWEATAAAPAQNRDARGEWINARAYEATQSIELMGLSLLTKRPIAAMGVQTGAQELGDVRARGGSANEALMAGTVTGASESFFERYFGLGWMLGNFGKRATSKFIGGMLLREVPSEMATTAVQNLADAMVTGGAGWEGYKQNLPGDLLNTAASTALMVGAIGGAHHVANRVKPELTAVHEIEAAAAGGEFLDRLATAAAQSKTKKEDPETLRDFIDQRTESTPVRSVYVPVEAVAQYMQSDGYGGELDRYEAQIAEAQATQGDVVIPIGDAVAYLADTPAWEALHQDMRVTPGGLSRNEATQKHEEIIRVLEQRGKEIAEEAKAEDAVQSDAAEVYSEVKNRLRSGGVDEKQADAIAQLYAARYEARSSRLGGTAMEQFRSSGIVFPGEEAETAGRQFAQDVVVNVGLNVPEGGKITAAQAIKALKAQGVDVTASEVRQSATEPTLIARLSKPLTPEQGHAVSEALKQEAIAQRVDHKGDLFGPAAERWGPFNRDFFLEPGDRTVNQPAQAQRTPTQDVLPEVGWTPERVSGLIDAYAREDGSTSAIAVMMTPDEYLGLNASARGREIIEQRVSQLEEYGGELDVQKLNESGPIYLAIKLGGEPSDWQKARGTRPPNMIAGHAGRHRMALLKKAGVERYPVVVEVLDPNGRPAPIKEPIQLSNIVPNRSRSDQTANGDLKDFELYGIPISWRYKDQLSSMASRQLNQTIKLRGFGEQRVPAFDVGIPNTLNERERIIDGGGVTIIPFNGRWRLNGLRAIERGGGRRALQRVLREADTLNVEIELSAVPLDAPAGKKMSEDELVAWYEQFGFHGPADKMVREPDRELNQGPRGTTIITDSQKIIQLFGTADRSTLLHETGHVWLEELKQDGGADWEITKKWFAANGAKVTKEGFIPTEAHELWARGFERYLMEGKAPSQSLRGVFSTFKAWLLRIYGVVQNLNSPITPEVREVFDRLIATDQAIADARGANETAPLFKSAEEAGMTEAEFADYQERVANARDEAYDTLLYKTMEKIRRERTQEMRDVRSATRDEVAQKVSSQPQFRLLHLLRTGRWLGEPEREPVKVKLNTGWLIDNYGEDVLERLPRGLPITAGDGETGDVIAEMIGMNSGSEVVHALVGMRAASDELRARGETRSLRDLMVDVQVDEIMAERFGDPLTDGTIEEEAIAALNTARQGEIIASEARQLSKRRSVLGVPTPYQFAREWAKRTVAAGHVRDVASRAALQRYTRAANKSARAAEEAILKGDTDEAYRQKQAQLLNHALLAEAKAAADRIDIIVARMKKLAKRAGMKSVDPEYLDKIHMLLENYDFRDRTQRSIDEQEGFQEWAERQRARGFEVHIPPRLENNGDPYTRVSVQELESLNDMIESLLNLGRSKQKLKVAQAEREFSEFRDEVMARLEKLPTRNLKERVWVNGKLISRSRSPINENERKLAAAASELLKVETIVEELDGGPVGPMHDAIILGSTNAENRRFALREKVLKPIADMYNALGRKQWKRLQERVTIPELTWNTLNEGDPRLGQNVTVTRMELMSVLMNMGNLSNLEKLSKGERWPVETLRNVMNRELTKEDFDFAQKLWDQVEGLWSDIVETEREMAGVVPEKVVNAPLETPFGTYRGGYWPVVYDAARWQRAEDLEGQQLDDMFGLKSGVATQKGHTITRTAAFGPINLSIEKVLFSHIEQVVTRIAFADYARDVLRIVRDRSIRGMIDTKLGPEYRKQFEKWLARQVHEGAVHAKAARWWDGLLRQLRANMTIAAMGLRFSTGVAQTLGLTASADRIGAKWVGFGLKQVALRPRESVAFAFTRSPELLHRAEAVNREIAELSLKMRQKHSWWSGMQHWAMFHIGLIDRYVVALPTWIGAHAKAISEGMTDEEATAQADKEVRQSQGSGREKDLSAFQSPNSEAMRFFSMFYTPWNVLFNAQWQAARDLRKGDPRKALSVTFWWLIVSTLGDAMLSGDWPGDDDDAWLKWFGRNVFFGLWAGIPLVRDFTNAAERKLAGQYSDYSQTPVTRVYDAVDKAWMQGKRLHEGKDIKNPIKQTGDLSATLLGIPTSQPGATAQFLWDTHQGNADPKSVSDWYFGLTKGKVPDEKTTKDEKAPLL